MGLVGSARACELGEPLTTVAETDSTNDDALAAADEGAPHGATFVADAQRKARGRRGSELNSPAGENLTFSVLLRPDVAADKVSAIALVAGLAVRDAAAARVQETVVIKWANDVLVEDQKLAGNLGV